MSALPAIKLPSGQDLPMLGLGTWRLNGEECTQAVKSALALGYMHIDTAEMYQNEQEVRCALKNVAREQLFLTSKVFHNHLHHDDVIAACLASLNRLGVRDLDLFLIHWPNRNVPMKETFTALANLQANGMVRAIGVSNFTVRHLQEAKKASPVPIAVNQVECHPFLRQDELLAFCRQHKIQLVAYSPLARGKVYQDKTLIAIGKTHKKTAGQIALRWLHQRGIVAIPKASSEKHLRENLEIFDFALTAEEMAAIDALPQQRIINPSFAEF